jgi:MtN3 and saliva related transmembrane protein
MTEFIGWTASAILLITIISQVRKQWRTGSNDGVSKWLFVGQVASSIGFTVYSVLTVNWVFIVTNAMLLLSNIAGVYIFFKNRERGSEDDKAGPQAEVGFNRQKLGGRSV